VAEESDSLHEPHFANGRFFNPWGVSKAGFRDVARWKLFSKNAYGRRRPPEVPRVENDGSSLVDGRQRGGPPELHWVGHSTFVLRDGAHLLLTDPHFGPRALLPGRHHPPGVPLAAIPAHAVALLSHNHYDHLDRATLAGMAKGVAWRVPLGLAGFVRAFGFDDVEELDWWQSVDCRGFRLTLLPAQHWSRRLSQPDETTLWGSWLVESENVELYFAGDSGYFHGFAEFGRRFPGLDVALLPIGAYEPRWFMRPVHMNPAEALAAFRELGARHLLPMHWGTFDLTDEPIDEPPRELARCLEEDTSGVSSRVTTLPVGGTFRLDGQ
jgi:L-ascorbate metabolism protein UlaG (beta-lactamase superfamily)